MKKFRQYIHHIEDWLKEGTLMSHEHEIESEMNDMKFYLQNFLAMFQRIEKDENQEGDRFDRLLNQTEFQLLEYRYLFGKFFYHLLQKGVDGSQLRRQFLFVDQYLDYTESKIESLRSVGPLGR